MINTPIPVIEVGVLDAESITSLYRATLKAKGENPKIVVVDVHRLYTIHKVTCMLESRVAIEKAMRNARQN